MKRVILSLAVVAAFAGGARADDAAAAARKACTDAMNADPTFAQAIVQTVDKTVAAKLHDADLDVEKLHNEANERVQRNQSHVVYAYAAMWIAAVGFLVFLWRRQQGLKDQIARLSADLERALAEEKKT